MKSLIEVFFIILDNYNFGFSFLFVRIFIEVYRIGDKKNKRKINSF